MIKAQYRTTDGVLERLCAGCNTWRPFDAKHFHRNATTTTGLQTRCMVCQRATCKVFANARYRAKTAAGAAQMLAEVWPTQRHGRKSARALKRLK